MGPGCAGGRGRSLMIELVKERPRPRPTFLSRSRVGVLLAGALALPVTAQLLAEPAAFRDRLDVPAVTTKLADRSPIQGLARAGNRLVAVGQRGHILYSDDQGATWLQAAVPVSSDLLAVNFVSATHGWTVGHDGVVLHSADGGKSWQRQLDGRQIAELLRSTYTEEKVSGFGLTQEEQRALLTDVERLAAQGPENPLLAVWFADEKTGYVAGAFNLIFRTVNGGASWEPLFHKTINPQRFHFYAISSGPQGLLLAGEQGIVLRLDDRTQKFLPFDTGYRGTFFGLLPVDGTTYVFGLRGHLFRADNSGWRKIDSSLRDGLVSAAICPAGGWLLASRSGQIAIDDGLPGHRARLATPGLPVSAVLCLDDGQALIGGAAGLRKVDVK